MNQLKAILATLAVFTASLTFVVVIFLLFTTAWGPWVVMAAPVLLIAYLVYEQFLDKFNDEQFNEN